jgi:O-antigen/teichoic acid export membrane protein
VLGAKDSGIYACVQALVALLAIPAQSGLPTLIILEIARGMAQGRPDHVQGVWRWSARLVGILSLGLALLAAPLFFIWRSASDPVKALTPAWALALIPIGPLGNLRGAASMGLKRIVAGQLPEYLLGHAIFRLLLAGAQPLVPHALTPSLATTLNVAAFSLAFIFGAWMLRR